MSDSPDNSHSEMSNDPNDTPVMTSYVEPDEPDAPEAYADYDDDFGARRDPARAAPAGARQPLQRRPGRGADLGAACFYGGVRVEKSEFSSTGTTGGTGLAALASRFGGGLGHGLRCDLRDQRAHPWRRFRRRRGRIRPSGRGGRWRRDLRNHFHDQRPTPSNLTETSGNTVKVKLSSATTLTKTVSVSKRSLYPGDTVSVTGSAGTGGTVSATRDLGTPGRAPPTPAQRVGDDRLGRFVEHRLGLHRPELAVQRLSPVPLRTLTTRKDQYRR